MNYKVGDTVVCIDAMTLPGMGVPSLRVGATYKVLGILRCCQGTLVIVNDGAPFDDKDVCIYCDKPIGDYVPWRFIKLDGLHEEEKAKDTATA